jgi:ligand-binding sensor domain-containing protein
MKLGDGVAWIGTSNGLAQLNTQALTVDQFETSSQSEGEVVPVPEENFLPEGIETQND